MCGSPATVRAHPAMLAIRISTDAAPRFIRQLCRCGATQARGCAWSCTARSRATETWV